MRRIRSAVLVLSSAMFAAWGASLPAAAAVRYVPFAYATIQAAVDAALPGDTIQIGVGEYRENVVILTPGLTLSGTCGSAVIVDGTIAAVNGDAFTVQAAGTKLVCLTIRNGLDGIDNDADSLFVDQVRFVHNGEMGVRTSGPRSRILNSSFTGTRGNAIFVSGSDAQIKSNTIRSTGSPCIAIEFAERVVVDTNTIVQCDGEGILATGSAHTVVNNVIESTNGAGISLAFADDGLVTSNKVSYARNAGIYFSGERARVRTNQVESTSNEGIYLVGNDAEVKGNSVKIAGLGAGPHACYSIQGDRETIDGNTASVCGYSGIETRGQDPIVKNNRVERMGGGGLGIDVFCNPGSSSGRVELNTATGASGYDGFFIYCPEVPGFVVLKNTATNNAGYGFELFLSDATISENNGSQNGSFRENGFYINGFRNAITYNVANDNIEDGFYVCGGSNSLRFNQARRNQDGGFVLDCDTGNTLQSSTSQYNLGEGIAILTSPNTLTSNVSLNNRAPRNGKAGDCANDSGGALTLTGNVCADGSNFLVPSDLEN